jgi:hypothetical protein
MASALAAWELDWLWALLLIVMSVVIHVVGLMIIFREAVKVMSIAVVRRRFAPMFIGVMGWSQYLQRSFTDLRARYGLHRIGFLAHCPMVSQRCSTRSVR